MQKQEIERKFLIKKLPDLKWVQSIRYERHFIFRDKTSEIRVQKKWNDYEFERKSKTSELSSDKQKFKITESEFAYFKGLSKKSLIRESYLISSNPEVSIKIYHWKFEWLIRIEVEFKSEEEAFNYIAPDWMGKEITSTPLGKDSKLLDLSEAEFKQLLKSY